MTDFLKILPAIVTVILSVSDAFFYGYCYEKKKWLRKTLFYEVTFKGKVYVPFYRILIQWPLDFLAVGLSYKYCGVWSTLLMLGAWFCMIKEGLYYIFLLQWKELKRMEAEQNYYWLNRPYFAGSFVFIGGFTIKKFAWCFIISCLFLIASVIIQFI